jgi:hypothetical protein
MQRLAHTHEHHVGDRRLRLAGGGCLGELAARLEYLIDDFVRREATLEPEGRGRAKSAAHAAPDLRRDAERQPIARLGGNQHALDPPAVGKPEQKLPRAVLCADETHELRARDHEAFHESLAQPLREVAHLGEGAGASLVNPLEDLSRAVGRLTLRCEPGGELLRRELFQVAHSRCPSSQYGRTSPDAKGPRARVQCVRRTDA